MPKSSKAKHSKGKSRKLAAVRVRLCPASAPRLTRSRKPRNRDTSCNDSEDSTVSRERKAVVAPIRAIRTRSSAGVRAVRRGGRGARVLAGSSTAWRRHSLNFCPRRVQDGFRLRRCRVGIPTQLRRTAQTVRLAHFVNGVLLCGHRTEGLLSRATSAAQRTGGSTSG
jgi:hypothetical protein